MASYYLHGKTYSRAKGGRATRLAAYRAGERIRDERTSDVYNFSSREDVAHKEIVLASQYAGRADMEWARDRATLWNAAEYAGKRRNSRLAREVFVLLPPELTAPQRTELARAFAQELADRYRNAVDVAIHTPRPDADQRHHHAHLFMTTREVTPDGLGPRTDLELSGTERHARGLGPSKNDYLLIRARWAQVTNDALRRAGVAARIDHRSLKAQGLDREPKPAIPQKLYYAEKKSGLATEAGEAVRARYRERVEARQRGGDALVRVMEKQTEQARQALERNGNEGQGGLKIRRSMLTRDQLNEKRRERHNANAASLNATRREKYLENAAARREKYNAWRQSNATRINEQRSARRKEKLGAREVERSKTSLAQEAPRADLSKLSPAERLSRENAAAAIKAWREFRARENQAETSKAAARGRARDRGSAAADANDEGGNDKAARRRDKDFAL
jgi:hypothetical protein